MVKLKYRVLVGPLSAKMFQPARLRAFMDDVNEKWMYFSFDSEEQLREHYPKENFPDLVSGHRVESPNGKQTTYYSLLARDAQNEQWVSATSDPR